MNNNVKSLYVFHNQAMPTKGRSLIYFVFTLLLASSIHTPASSQLKLYPVSKNTEGSLNLKSSARTQSIPTLPFWDDFSFYSTDAGGAPKANTDLWEISESVWINNGMGINSPTVYVATFDGLDSKNLPYNPTQILENGSSDTLQSRPIDLSTVPATNIDSVYLSFFYQWKGNGEGPDKTDYLVVEFKDNTNKWIVVETILPGETPDPTKFILKLIKVKSPTYHHSGFQFRIRRYGRASGPFDTWNIDYVYLNINRYLTENSFPDRAAASAISPLFKPYRSIPLSHFFETKKLDKVTFDVQNLKNQNFASLSYSATAQFTNYYKEPTSPTKSTVTLVGSAPINEFGGFIDPFQRNTVKLGVLPNANDPLQFDPLATSVDVRLKMQVISDDQSDTKKYKFSLPPTLSNQIDLRINDSISTTSILHNFYAYDDGIAEYSVGLTQPGNSAAVEFDMLTEKEDTLIGFNIYFPDFAVSTNLSMDFTIYSDIAGTSETILLPIRSRNIVRKGFNVFTYIPFNPPLVVKDKFYIGWTQPIGSTPKIGLDIGNDAGDKIYVKTNGTWNQNISVHGSIMIRPIFGSGDIVTSLPEEKTNLTLYPNPNEGTFFVKGEYDQLHVTSITGQSLSFNTESFGDRDKISIHAAPGLYLVHVRKGTTSQVKKIIIR